MGYSTWRNPFASHVDVSKMSFRAGMRTDRSHNTHRNESYSSLLHLPPEFRNTIWSYAYSVQKVLFPVHATHKGGRIQLDHQGDTTKTPSAFHLPEVCRHIYAETALMSYRGNVFIYDVRHLKPMNRLLLVQRRAITSIEPYAEALEELTSSTGYPGSVSWKLLPSLVTIYVSNVAIEALELDTVTQWVDECQPGERLRILATNEWTTWEQQRLQRRGGGDIKVIFE